MGEYGYPVQQLSAGVIYVDGFRECGTIAGSFVYQFFRGIVWIKIKQQFFMTAKLF
jgi:hypothetical protein